jgi:hypothetical protein
MKLQDILLVRLKQLQIETLNQLRDGDVDLGIGKTGIVISFSFLDPKERCWPTLCRDKTLIHVQKESSTSPTVSVRQDLANALV